MKVKRHDLHENYPPMYMFNREQMESCVDNFEDVNLEKKLFVFVAGYFQSDTASSTRQSKRKEDFKDGDEGLSTRWDSALCSNAALKELK